MSLITNPMNAMTSLHAEIYNGIPLSACKVNPDIKMLVDQPNGGYRFTFIKVESNIITAFATYIFVDAKDGLPCVSIGYAVPPKYQRRGLGAEIVTKSIAELKSEFVRVGINRFYVEAVIGIGSVASQS